MTVCSTFNNKDKAREASLILFISAIQAAPETVPKGLSCDEYIKYLIAGAEKLVDYIQPGKTA